MQSTSSRDLEIEGIDLASFLVATGYDVQLYRSPDGRRAVFCFKDQDGIREAITLYECGGTVAAKRLLNVRSRLFREASDLCKGVNR